MGIAAQVVKFGVRPHVAKTGHCRVDVTSLSIRCVKITMFFPQDIDADTAMVTVACAYRCPLCVVSQLRAGRPGRTLRHAFRTPPASPSPKAKVEAEDQATMARYSVLSDERGEYHLLGLARRPVRAHRRAAGVPHLSAVRHHAAPGGPDGARCEARGRPALAVRRRRRRGAPLLQTASGEVSLNIDEKKISTLPLDGRNFIPLVTLSPGVALPNGQFLPRINGSRPRTNEYIYDGISVLQPEPGQVVYYPIIDGMAEFKLNVNAYSPEYGRSNGGTVMVIGKSGSNDLHGSLFEFFRNEALNARNLFAQPGPKPEFRRNQYGVTLGGPIQTNKTFFFADWQGTRLRTGITRFSVVPTLAQRQGIFTQADLRSRHLAAHAVPEQHDSGEPLRSDRRCRFCSTTRCPNVAGANNFVRTATEPDNQDQADFRLDRYFGEKHRVFGRYTFFRDDDTPVTPLPDGSGSLTSGVIGHAITRGDAFAGDYNWTPSPSALNQFRFGYSRRDLNQSSLQNGGITVPGPAREFLRSVLPIFTVAGLQQIGPTTAANSNFTTSITEFLDTVHAGATAATRIKFGTDIRREALDVLNPPNPTGSFAFTTTAPTAPSVAGSGNALASLLLGQVNAFTHRHSEAGDSAARAHRRVLRRRRLEGLAAPHPEHRHALHAQLPFHRRARSGRRLQPAIRRCWIFRTPRASWSAAISARASGWPTGSATAG